MIAYILIVVGCLGAILFTELTSPGNETRIGQIAGDTLEEVTRIDIDGDGKIGKCPDKEGEVEKK